MSQQIYEHLLQKGTNLEAAIKEYTADILPLKDPHVTPDLIAGILFGLSYIEKINIIVAKKIK